MKEYSSFRSPKQRNGKRGMVTVLTLASSFPVPEGGELPWGWEHNVTADHYVVCWNTDKIVVPTWNNNKNGCLQIQNNNSINSLSLPLIDIYISISIYIYACTLMDMFYNCSYYAQHTYSYIFIIKSFYQAFSIHYCDPFLLKLKPLAWRYNVSSI